MDHLVNGKVMLKFRLSKAADYTIFVDCLTPCEGVTKWLKLRFSHLSRIVRTAIEGEVVGNCASYCACDSVESLRSRLDSWVASKREDDATFWEAKGRRGPAKNSDSTDPAVRKKREDSMTFAREAGRQWAGAHFHEITRNGSLLVPTLREDPRIKELLEASEV